MQETIIRDLCDLCFHIDGAEIKRDADHEQEVGIGKKTYKLMWCDDHAGKTFTLTDMFELFEQYGTVVDTGKAPGPVGNFSSAGPKKRRGSGLKRYICPYCKEKEQVYKRIDYYQAHLFKAHKVGSPPEMEKCDFPGCEEVREKKRGIGNHKQRKHGIIGIQNSRKEDRPDIKEYNAKLYEQARQLAG